MVLVTYPELEPNVLGSMISLFFFKVYPHIELSSVEVLHLSFSHQNLLACVSSVMTNLLSIWDFVKGERICEANLNFVCPDIFGFCVTNENKLFGATERKIYVWTLEPYGNHHHLSCR